MIKDNNWGGHDWLIILKDLLQDADECAKIKNNIFLRK